MRVTYFRTAYVDNTTAEERDLVDQNMNTWAEGDGGTCVTRESISEWLVDHVNSSSESDKKLTKFLTKVEEAFDEKPIGDVIFCS